MKGKERTRSPINSHMIDRGKKRETKSAEPFRKERTSSHVGDVRDSVVNKKGQRGNNGGERKAGATSPVIGGLVF